jgi:hypothetical protein
MNRLEIAMKILQWEGDAITKHRKFVDNFINENEFNEVLKEAACIELGIEEIEFERMSDEEFFNVMFEYSHNNTVMVAS